MSYQNSVSDPDNNGYGPSGHSAHQNIDDEYTQCHTEVYDNIKTLTSLFGTISQLYQSVGGKQDGPKLRNQLKANIDTAVQLVRNTQNTIKRLASLCNNSRAGKEKRQRVDKLSQDFDKFNEKLKELVRMATDKKDSTPLPPERSSHNSDQLYSRSPISEEDRQQEENKSLLEAQRQDQLVQIDDELDFQDAIIQERNEQIRAVQGQMVQVNDIFQYLAGLVEEQGEHIDNIQTNIELASQHVVAAGKELKGADKSQQSSRKKLCFLAIFVTIIIAVVVVVLVLTVGKKQ